MDRILGQRRGREHHLVPLRAKRRQASALHGLDVSLFERLGYVAFQRKRSDSNMIIIAVLEERDEHRRRALDINGKHDHDRPRLCIK
ncbi:hypothetical protein [Frankia sp. Cj3]|uniref:hypothetical protein n=1 Tax=Frankia sp. Cj3 TaxID=2880976 RepID=UPI001EF60127|nr:hypothetical protein [Frankia sp. Cj3]